MSGILLAGGIALKIIFSWNLRARIMGHSGFRSSSQVWPFHISSCPENLTLVSLNVRTNHTANIEDYLEAYTEKWRNSVQDSSSVIWWYIGSANQFTLFWQPDIELLVQIPKRPILLGCRPTSIALSKSVPSLNPHPILWVIFESVGAFFVPLDSLTSSRFGSL